MMATLVDQFDRVMAEGPNPKKKDLLRRLVKKVLVHDRRTIEIWYGLPNPQGCEDWNNWLPIRSAAPTKFSGRPQNFNSFSAGKPCQIMGLREGFERDPRMLPHFAVAPGPLRLALRPVA
jgi:hypothetical protein